ncbi:hypothetical protein GCM10009414_08920 [Tatumella terrea]
MELIAVFSDRQAAQSGRGAAPGGGPVRNVYVIECLSRCKKLPAKLQADITQPDTQQNVT